MSRLPAGAKCALSAKTIASTSASIASMFFASRLILIVIVTVQYFDMRQIIAYTL